MLAKYDALIQRMANYRLLLLFAVLFGLFGGLIMPTMEGMITQKAGQPIKILDLQIGLSASEVHTLVGAYGAEGRQFYRLAELTVDVVYPMVYTLFLGIALWLVYRLPNSTQPIRKFYRLPLLVLLVDYIENITIVILLSLYPTELPALAYFCSAMTLIKWAAFGSSILLVLVGLVWRLVSVPKVKVS